MITSDMLSKCVQELYTVCPSDMVLKTAGEQNCLIALFLGKVDIVFKRCKRLVLHETFETIWIRSPVSVTGYIVFVLLSGSQCSVKR